jgi:hypothetical protein
VGSHLRTLHSRRARKRSPARHDGTRPARARWRLTRAVGMGLGLRGRFVVHRRESVGRAASCQTVRTRSWWCFGDDEGRERSGSTEQAPPATRRGGSASGARRHRQRSRERSMRGIDASAIRARTEAGAPYRASPARDPPARTVGIDRRPPEERRRCLVPETRNACIRREGAREQPPSVAERVDLSGGMRGRESVRAPTTSK